MNSSSPTRFVLRSATGAALLALVLAGGYAAYDVLSSTWVLEFQAGDASSSGERWISIAQRTAIEVLGFGLLGGFVAILALCLARFRRVSEHAPSNHAACFLVLASAATIVWIEAGTFVAEAALPFLQPWPLLWTNVVGLFVTVLAFFLFDTLVRLMPFRPRGAPASVAVASVLAAAVALWFAGDIVRSESGGWRSPALLGQAAGIFLAGIIVAALLAWLLRAPLEAFVARMSRRALTPRPLALFLGALALASILGSLPFLEYSALKKDAVYRDLPGRGTPAGANVILVTIDTLRADHLSCYGYGRPTSPVIDQIAAEGARFADPVAAASWTKPATGTILTGLYPSRHGALYHGSSLQLPEGERTLAQAFQDAGYVTAGFVSNPNCKRVFDFDRGFDEFFDSPVEDTITLASIRGSWFGRVMMKVARHQFNWKYENDVHQMNSHAFAWLDQNHDEKFFLYLHYIDPHIPYTPPSPYLEEFSGDHGFPIFQERRELVGIDLYDGEIRYADAGMGELVSKLKELDLWEDTLFVLTSDHGEEFFEHEVLGHGFSLYQPVVQVPLIMRGPGVPAATVVEDPVQILDMPATILDLVGTGDERLGDGQLFRRQPARRELARGSGLLPRERVRPRPRRPAQLRLQRRARGQVEAGLDREQRLLPARALWLRGALQPGRGSPRDEQPGGRGTLPRAHQAPDRRAPRTRRLPSGNGLPRHRARRVGSWPAGRTARPRLPLITPMSGPLLLLTIDVEEDMPGWQIKQPTSVSNVSALPRLAEMCASLGVRPTYLCDYPVLSDPSAGDTLRRLHGEGDCEIGTHLHAWTNPPFEGVPGRDGDERDIAYYQSELGADVLRAKLEKLHEAAEAISGESAVSFRAGRFGIDGVSLQELVKLGYRVDSSITPLADHRADEGPDFRSAPPLPYRPDARDVTRPGDLPIVEIPVSIALTRPLPQSLQRAYVRIPQVTRLRGILSRDFLGLVDYAWLYPVRFDTELMSKTARALRQARNPVLNVFLHSSELAPGVSGRVHTEADVDQVFERLRGILEFCRTEFDAVPATLGEAGEKLAPGLGITS